MVERQQFIDAMRGVAHSVTIVTTNGPAGMHGATVSAFCSVSADPPTVLICLNAASKISELVLQNKTFTITVLPENSQYLADRFAGRFDTSNPDRFANIEVKDGAPLIEGATVFDCQLDGTLASGSHRIVTGKVNSCDSGTQSPLAYLNGAYHCVSKFPEAAE